MTTGKQELPNRWAIVAAAILMQIALGAVYGWSVFVNPLMEQYGWSRSEVTLAFTLAILFLGFGTILGGLLQDRKGPRLVATIAGIFYGLSYILTALATSLPVLYLTYGVIGGVAMGMGYIVPVAVLVKWFPDKRGLITGLAVCGYGAGALLMSPIAAWMIETYGLSATFALLGVAYLIMVTGAAQFYRNPPEGWSPPGWTPTEKQMESRAARDFGVREALRTRQFWMLFFMLFLNVSAGIMIISQASPMGQEIINLDAVESAALVVGIISLFNAFGRIFWAAVSDWIGRRGVFIIMFLLQALLFLFLPNLNTVGLFVATTALIALCYGGGFGTMPSFCADYFGTKNVGGIYGWMLLAWGLAAVPSPLMIARIRELTGTYTIALYVIAAVMAAAVILPRIVRPPRKAEESSPPTSRDSGSSIGAPR
ncbi:OFA family oxalate/formate antiporter-like MFS transporter [Planifilum fimeticola]|uniref:OFA family oxalate/formate antiporter-like MFS transporter n=1 Tax=Planifilum fimeticola TaxID=201975 RepID=A0A2T0LFR1_9BACL|nr:OFA family MFS transporter [Planifilum fimeticola]PRX41090.1 OFA family oxalate/formate antiporter-like MFS transporter [Planifilum fimeticola]